MMFLRSTDLPVPDGPMMALILPLGRSKVMSSSTVCDPNRFVTPLSEMIASSACPPSSARRDPHTPGEATALHSPSPSAEHIARNRAERHPAVRKGQKYGTNA